VPRLFRTYWPFALSLCAVTACRVSPPVSNAGADIHLTPDTTVVEGAVPGNTTLSGLLRAKGLAADVVEGVIAAARTVFDPRRLRSQQPYALELTFDGALRQFHYEIDQQSLLRVWRGRSGPFRAAVLPIPRTLEHVEALGRIDSDTPSLFASIDAAGEGADLALALADVFSAEIDFNTELQPGDSYAVAFERFSRDGRPHSYGAIAAAEFLNDGRRLRAIRFTPPGGKPGYYDEQGRSLKRFFLRTPLKFEPRITSSFSVRRMHPVLHTARAHRGVDYGAPTGAPVVAVASGTVAGVTSDSTNGRMVRLRHASGYESYYLHLSAFAPGLRQGARVSQGETVGRVGSSGLATGPHLHYGLKKNGVFVNPLLEHRNMPPGDPIPDAALAAFHAERDRALARLELARENRPVPPVTTE
jgi:murein DD-endopeptidase MepM/ murein hydrolase activator NlpD